MDQGSGIIDDEFELDSILDIRSPDRKRRNSTRNLIEFFKNEPPPGWGESKTQIEILGENEQAFAKEDSLEAFQKLKQKLKNLESNPPRPSISGSSLRSPFTPSSGRSHSYTLGSPSSPAQKFSKWLGLGKEKDQLHHIEHLSHEQSKQALGINPALIPERRSSLAGLGIQDLDVFGEANEYGNCSQGLKRLCHKGKLNGAQTVSDPSVVDAKRHNGRLTSDSGSDNSTATIKQDGTSPKDSHSPNKSPSLSDYSLFPSPNKRSSVYIRAMNDFQLEEPITPQDLQFSNSLLAQFPAPLSKKKGKVKHKRSKSTMSFMSFSGSSSEEDYSEATDTPQSKHSVFSQSPGKERETPESSSSPFTKTSKSSFESWTRLVHTTSNKSIKASKTTPESKDKTLVIGTPKFESERGTPEPKSSLFNNTAKQDQPKAGDSDFWLPVSSPSLRSQFQQVLHKASFGKIPEPEDGDTYKEFHGELNPREICEAEVAAVRLSFGLPAHLALHPGPKSQQHPHHIYTWTMQNLWCFSCSTTHKCAICTTTCCVFTSLVSKISEYSSPAAPDTAAMREKAELARASLERLGALKGHGAHQALKTFVKCMRCKKEVCPDCSGRCPVALCGEVRCAKCVEGDEGDVWERCDWHGEDD